MGSVETIIYLLIILCILSYIKIRISKTTVLADNSMLKACLNEYLLGFKEGAVIIIYLDYNSTTYSEIDTLITNESDKFIVVFRAPAWLFTLKMQMWKQHVVINGEKVPFLSNNEVIVRRTKTGRLQYFNNQREFLEYHRAKSTFLTRLEKKFLRRRN
ncbi:MULTISPECIES: hypothetical protein [unclassified Paenibacillus]|uniref:hypothetical protein n=1 Tax=unclassified Paenibacillus TaxID=185978 RepID=UPI0009713963|nr:MULTISPECIES: hypothetical protein [unclassified Paenibacillus]